MRKTGNNLKGFSLLEITVSLGIFSFLMIMATGIFQSVVRGQQSAIASQDTQESLRYVFEVMGKEVRNAQKGGDGPVHACDLGTNSGTERVFNEESVVIFGNTSDIFYFQNKYGHCVYYYLENDILMLRYDDMIGGVYTASTTPKSIEVTDFDVDIHDNDFGAGFGIWIQPYVAIRITAKAKGHEFLNNETKMQTTISSRMYE